MDVIEKQLSSVINPDGRHQWPMLLIFNMLDFEGRSYLFIQKSP